MFRRRERLTPEQKADLRWERMQSQPKTMGMVGIFNDLNPGAKHADAQIVYEREAFVDQGSEGDGPGEGTGKIVYVDRRIQLPGEGNGTFTVRLDAAKPTHRPDPTDPAEPTDPAD